MSRFERSLDGVRRTLPGARGTPLALLRIDIIHEKVSALRGRTVFLTDMSFVFIPEISDRGKNRVRSRLTQPAQSPVLDGIAQFFQEFHVAFPAFPFYDTIQDLNARESCNGRLARNKVEEAILNQSRRILAEGTGELDLLTAADFDLTLPAEKSDLAQAITKDPYNFDFLTIREKYDETELKDALMNNITRFLLELGNGFAFVGREVRLEIGETENFIDMLFYNIKLHSYVVVEVKVKEFESGDMGQLGTYMVAVNHQLRGELDGPTLGLLICRSKDNIKARYALEASSQPMGISEYDINTFLPEEYKGSMPTIEEIEAELADPEGGQDA